MRLFGLCMWLEVADLAASNVKSVIKEVVGQILSKSKLIQ